MVFSREPYGHIRRGDKSAVASVLEAVSLSRPGVRLRLDLRGWLWLAVVAYRKVVGFNVVRVRSTNLAVDDLRKLRRDGLACRTSPTHLT